MANKPSQKFKVITRLKPAGTKINLRGSLPGERVNKGEATNIAVTAYDSEHRKTITLLQKLAEGGEGAVFTTNIPGHVAKIYKREKLTTDRKTKIEIMVSKQIVRKAICFPEAIIENEQSEFVGYLMPQAKGIELGKSVFQPKLLLQKFPNWNKRDLVQLCLTMKRCELQQAFTGKAKTDWLMKSAMPGLRGKGPFSWRLFQHQGQALRLYTCCHELNRKHEPYLAYAL